MKIINTSLRGLRIISHKRHSDSRGSLRETYNKKIIYWDKFIFEYATISRTNVLRGFHFQSKFKQAKYVSVLRGKILDYVIDLRRKSKTFGKSFKIELSDKNCKSLYIPNGFAHAYYSYSKLNIIYYKLSNYYHPEYENGIFWNDKFLKVKWPVKKPIVSIKDRKLKTFLEFKRKFKGL